MIGYYKGKKLNIGYFSGKKIHEAIKNSLKLTATQNGSSIAYTISGTLTGIQIQISEDGKTWTNWDGTAVTLDNGEFRYIRNTANILSKGFSDYLKFVMTGKIAASGDVSSMINFAELSDYCFLSLFSNCGSLVSAPLLPATDLKPYCYANMFEGCSSLTESPELPATVMKEACYYGMFYNCSSLTEIPELPSLTLATYCYGFMFNGCSSLTKAPKLLATDLLQNCYRSMFNDCSNLKVNENGAGTLIVAIPPNVQGTDVAQDMFTGTSGSFTSGTPITGNIYNWYE